MNVILNMDERAKLIINLDIIESSLFDMDSISESIKERFKNTSPDDSVTIANVNLISEIIDFKKLAILQQVEALRRMLLK